MRSAVDPEGRRLPIKLDSTSNGEFVPEVAREKAAYAERPEPHFRTYGPKTQREFVRFAGSPG